MVEMVKTVSFCGNLDKELSYEFEIVRYVSLQLLDRPRALNSTVREPRAMNATTCDPPPRHLPPWDPTPRQPPLRESFSIDQLAKLGFHATGTTCGIQCYSCEREHKDVRDIDVMTSLHRDLCLHDGDRRAGNVTIEEYGEAHLMHDMGKLRCEVCRHNHVNSIDVITGKLRHCDVCAGRHAIVLRDAGVRYNRVFNE